MGRHHGRRDAGAVVRALRPRDRSLHDADGLVVDHDLDVIPNEPIRHAVTDPDIDEGVICHRPEALVAPLQRTRWARAQGLALASVKRKDRNFVGRPMLTLIRGRYPGGDPVRVCEVAGNRRAVIFASDD